MPNDVLLGSPSGRAPFVVLSGPNMGGKSTLLRQCCLAAITAQVMGLFIQKEMCDPLAAIPES